MSKLKFSIIIPVYNGQDSISNALNSILVQSTDDYEVIIVNDGSTDDTRGVFERYCIENETVRISYYEISNSGPSTARNLGFSKAIGEYVMFLDADCIYNILLFEKLSIKLSKEKSDICIFAWETQKDNLQLDNSKKYCVKDSISGLSCFFEYHKGNVSLNNCSIIYKTSFLKENKIKYIDGAFIGEDRAFYFTSMLFAESVTFLDYIGFVSVLDCDSITRGKLHPKVTTEFLSYDSLYAVVDRLTVNTCDKEKILSIIAAMIEFTRMKVSQRAAQHLSYSEYKTFLKGNIIKKTKGAKYIKVYYNFKDNVKYTIFSMSKKLFYIIFKS